MAEKESQDIPGEHKKEKPVEKKVMGRVQITEDTDARTPGAPSYEHG